MVRNYPGKDVPSPGGGPDWVIPLFLLVLFLVMFGPTMCDKLGVNP